MNIYRLDGSDYLCFHLNALQTFRKVLVAEIGSLGTSSLYDAYLTTVLTPGTPRKTFRVTLFSVSWHTLVCPSSSIGPNCTLCRHDGLVGFRR